MTKSTILAVHSGALGDVILFGRLLVRLSPAARVTLVAGGEKAQLLAGLGVVGRAMDFDALPMHDIFTESPDDSDRLGNLLGQHDRLISCFAAGDSRAQMRLALACGADQSAFLPIRPDEGFQGHLVELWCDMMGVGEPKGEERRAKGETVKIRMPDSSPFGPSPLAPRSSFFPAWPVPPAWRKQGRAALKELGLPVSRPVVIHVGAGAREKCWPLENFISLGWQLTSRDPGSTPVVFVLGPAELERLDKPLLAQLRKNFPVLEEPPLQTLAGVLATCDSYIGNDSGVSHLAAAVGADTLALFGPSNPRHFAPLGPSVRIVAAPSMTEITVARVLDEMNVERGR